MDALLEIVLFLVVLWCLAPFVLLRWLAWRERNRARSDVLTPEAIDRWIETLGRVPAKVIPFPGNARPDAGDRER